MVAQSGQKSRLKRTGANQQENRSVEIEPTISEMEDLLDMAIEYQDESNKQPTQWLKTFVTLRTGVPLEVLTGSSGDGKKNSLRVKAEVRHACP